MATFFARMVIPRSRSNGLESSNVSCCVTDGRKLPHCLSKASTRVVLPWSTWAMMARFRMSFRTLFIYSQSFTAISADRKRAGRILPACYLYNGIGAQRFEPKPIGRFDHSFYAATACGVFQSGDD